MTRRTCLKRTARLCSGTVYVVVLGVSLIVAVISIAAIHVVRIEMREVMAVNEISRARLMAESGIEFAICRVKTNPLWRIDYTSGVTNTLSGALGILAGSGQFSFTLTDTDGDLNDDSQDSVTLRSVGTAGDATSVVEVLLQPTGAGLSCLEASLHSSGTFVSQATVTTDQMISANALVDATHALAVVQGNAWSTGAVNGNVTGTSYQNQVPAREMPDPDSVFDYYVARGTAISISDLPTGRIEKAVLTSGHNPIGAGMTNPEGIYVVDCAGGSLGIRDCRIEGTLVVLNAAGGVRLENAIHWKAAVSNFPALMVQGPVQFDWDQYTSLSETSLGVNFNPTGAPYNSFSDNDTADTYPGTIDGLVYIEGDMSVTRSSKFTGVVVVAGAVQTAASIDLNYQSTFLNNAPPGFTSGSDMQIVPGTWKQVAN